MLTLSDKFFKNFDGARKSDRKGAVLHFLKTTETITGLHN